MDTEKAELTLETIEQVADMIWLLNEIDTIEIKDKPDVKESKEEPTVPYEKLDKVIKKPKKKPKDKPLIVKEEVSSVYENEVSSTKTDIKADPIRMPKKLALSNYRAWEKSFKSFYYKIDSTTDFVLDEAKTVDFIAKTKLVQPIFKAKKVKYFDLIMVIEQSPSMDIWNELILEFQKTIRRFGVFQSIDFYYLSSSKNAVHLYADRELKRELDPKKLNLNTQTLLTVVSDCVSFAWHSNHIFKMLEFWSKFVPVSITQMFPKRMWHGTSLYKGFQTSFTSHNFKQLNKNLLSDDGYYDEEDITFNIPVINFEPQSVKAWSSVIHGKRGKWIDGVILEELEELPFTEMSNSKKDVSVEERVNRYLSQASPLAQELARYASVLPISFHVIRVLQELKLPESSQVHLAEFFLGGLIKREVNEHKQVSFDFHDGVRDYFRNQLTGITAYKLQESISNFVSQNLNSSLDFQALIDNPNSTSGLYLSKDEVAFVKLRADTLRKLGGDYGREAEQLLKNIVLGDKNGLERTLKSEFLDNFLPLNELTGKKIDEYSRIFNYSFDLPARLARRFSKKYSKEVIQSLVADIMGTYGDVAWIKKSESNKVLWVDDRPQNNKKVKGQFEKIGLTVDIAKSTDEALALIDKNRYLVVLSDMGRAEGKQEGYVLLDKFRTFDKDTSFIFFANSDSLKNRKMTLERGGQGSTGNHIKLCRMVMNIIEDGRVEEYVVNHSIVLIESKVNNNFGTGFCIFKDDGGSYILTTTQILNELTIEDIKIDNFEVTLYSIGSIELTDLAILYVKDLFISPLELETNSLLSKEVYTIGYKASKLEHSQNRVDGNILGDKIAIISSEGVDNNLNLWKINGAIINKGYTGAPLISKESEKVIGIVSHKEGNTNFYAVAIDYLKNRIDDESLLPFKNLISLEFEKSDFYFSSKERNDAVVMIGSKENKSLGTGFVFDQDNLGSYILTTYHIIESTVIPLVNSYESVKVISINEGLDLAILYVEGLYAESLKFQDKNFSSREVELLGYNRFTKSEHRKEISEAKIVSNFLNIVNDDGSIYNAWKVMAYENYAFYNGISGAPLVSKESGKVIGIFTNKAGSNTGYSISIQYLQELIYDKSISAFKNLKSFNLEVNTLSFNKGNMSDSIVLVSSKNNNSFGTGFVVHQDGGGSYVVTAKHVIENTVEPIINYKYDVEIIRLSKVFELAILYVRDFYAEPFVLQNEDFSSRAVEIMGYSSFTQTKKIKEGMEAQIISDTLRITDSKSKSYKGWEIIVDKEHHLNRAMEGSPLISKETNSVIGILLNRYSANKGYAISIEHLKDVWND